MTRTLQGHDGSDNVHFNSAVNYSNWVLEQGENQWGLLWGAKKEVAKQQATWRIDH